MYNPCCKDADMNALVCNAEPQNGKTKYCQICKGCNTIYHIDKNGDVYAKTNSKK